MASPPTLPISQSNQGAAAPAPSQSTIATPALRAFLSRLSNSVRHGFSQRRPWSELLDRSSLSRPDSLTEAYSRIRKNVPYFRVNYAILPLVILGRTFSDTETLIGLVLVTVIVVFVSSVGSLLISTLLVGFAIVCAHGAFRVPEDLFLDDQDSPNTGFLSFLGGAASAAAPSLATRV
uniref:PRA1 family protein n=1 Tax=Cannabis sativa TaxID=3483 RepID=A0A803NU64_CANSA